MQIANNCEFDETPNLSGSLEQYEQRDKDRVAIWLDEFGKD